MCFERVKRFLESVKQENIFFKKHFHERTLERPVSEGMVRRYLKKSLIKAERLPAREEGEEKYKLWFRMSRRYSLVVIAVISEGFLYIITCWNSDAKWQKG